MPDERSEVPWDGLVYASYARRFGWTPQTVDQLPLVVEPWLLPIADALDDEQARRDNEAIEREQGKNKRGFGRRRR